MLKKEVILRTAHCYWSDEDACYVVESPFFPQVIAAEKTPQKAIKQYRSMLNPAYEELLKDNVHGFKRGRPAKNGVELHVQVQASTKELIEKLRKEIGISQSEFIDLIAFCYAKNAEPLPGTADVTFESTISELFDALQTQKRIVPRTKNATKHPAKKRTA